MFPIKLQDQVANGNFRSQNINLNNLKDDGGNRRLFFIFFFMCRGIEDRVLREFMFSRNSEFAESNASTGKVSSSCWVGCCGYPLR